MYVNKCVKCGREFETKNPKRVICPDCLYPDKKMMINPSETGPEQEGISQEQPLQLQPEQINGYSTETQSQFYSSYSAGDDRQRLQHPYNSQDGYQRRENRNNYQRRDNQSGYNRGGYNQNRQGNNQRRNYRGRQQGNYQRRDNRGYNQKVQGGNFNRGGFNNRRSMNKNKAPKQLLISKEQLEQIEILYKSTLPLPNPDIHEVIGEKIGLEPRKVFFGINLVRQKLMLPKLPFPKRKLAITPDQLFAIKNLYEPLLPLPPIGCHKIIAAQLKMDEWRVHVGIGLIRSQLGLERWNAERADAPEEYRKKSTEESAAVKEEAVAEEEKPKRGRKSKKSEETAEE